MEIGGWHFECPGKQMRGTVGSVRSDVQSEKPGASLECGEAAEHVTNSESGLAKGIFLTVAWISALVFTHKSGQPRSGAST